MSLPNVDFTFYVKCSGCSCQNFYINPIKANPFKIFCENLLLNKKIPLQNSIKLVGNSQTRFVEACDENCNCQKIYQVTWYAPSPGILPIQSSMFCCKKLWERRFKNTLKSNEFVDDDRHTVRSKEYSRNRENTNYRPFGSTSNNFLKK